MIQKNIPLSAIHFENVAVMDRVHQPRIADSSLVSIFHMVDQAVGERAGSFAERQLDRWW